MADIFHEVDEMMKQERIERFWKQNKNTIIAFVTIVIVGAAAFSIYNNWNEGVKRQQTEQLIALFELPDFPASAAETSKNLRPALRGIALLGAGQHEMAAQKPQSALTFYQQAADDTAIPEEFRDMAVIMQTRLDAAIDTAAKLDRLAGVYNHDNSPWRYHARLEAALTEAHERKDFGAARAHLTQILNAEGIVAQSLLNKAKSLDHVYALKQGAAPPQDTQAPATGKTSSDDKERS